jgi:hypothetical protein
MEFAMFEEPLKPGAVVGKEMALFVPAAAMSAEFCKTMDVALTYPRSLAACKSALVGPDTRLQGLK